jgi:hypothetical protein
MVQNSIGRSCLLRPVMRSPLLSICMGVGGYVVEKKSIRKVLLLNFAKRYAVRVTSRNLEGNYPRSKLCEVSVALLRTPL